MALFFSSMSEDDIGINKRKSGKWNGQVSDVAHSAMHPGSKQKFRYTPCFVSKSTAIKERAKLYKEVHDEYEAIVLQRVQADPLTRDLPRVPDDASKATPRRVYWVCSHNTKHFPVRMVVVSAGKKGFQWQRACTKCDPNNATTANTDSNNVSTILVCDAHGAQCRHENNTKTCLTCNNGKGRANFCRTKCGTIIAGKRTISQGGSGFCSGCDPEEQAKRQKTELEDAARSNRPPSFTSREQFFAISNSENFPDLEARAIGGVKCDEVVGAGASRRRPDLATLLVDKRVNQEVLYLDECDELLHLKEKKCYDRDGVLGKLSGEFSDMGAPAISVEDADYIESNPLTNVEMRGEVQNAKTRNVARILAKVTRQKASMIPIRVLSVGVDDYTDCHGEKHPSAFVEYRGEKGEKLIRTEPDEYKHRIECHVREKKKLLEIGAGGKPIIHVRLFYNGCDPETGLDMPSGSS